MRRDTGSSDSLVLKKPVAAADLARGITAALAESNAGGTEESLVSRASEGDRRLRILLAEDAPENQVLMVTVLDKAGHAVVIVCDGREAIEAFEKESFDLILMDVQMPIMGGLEATMRIREREALAGGHIPIIAITAHAMTGDRDRCLRAGMDDYMSKPIRREELLDRIQQLTSVSESAEASIRALKQLRTGGAGCSERPGA